MVKLSKRMKEVGKICDREQALSLDEAVSKLEQFPKVKFDETIELHLHLNVDPKSADQLVRGTVVLPHGTGKSIRIAVFAKDEQARKAKELGVEHVGAKELIDKVAGGFLDFDCVIATPDMMRDLSKLGKVLGPRGLMPSPKSGTVTQDVEKAVNEFKSGKIEFKVDKQSGMHIGVGKRSFTKEQLLKNTKHIIDAINNLKPSSVKGDLIRSLFLSSTMGGSVRIAT